MYTLISLCLPLEVLSFISDKFNFTFGEGGSSQFEQTIKKSVASLLKQSACKSNPCQNGATCFNYIGGYECQCTPGYSGKNCTLQVPRMYLGVKGQSLLTP